jgi:serine/threonine-protein kinase
VQFLGEGGMGSVYLALMRAEGAERFCVIKQMGSAFSDFGPEVPEIQKRFQREAELTMALDHPAIPKTFAVHHDQAPYLVQEFVDGINLGALVFRLATASESISIPLASHIVVQVAGALAYLHDFESKGLVHRDVSPDNVMLATTGEVKLIDFGVAKATACDDSLTQRGVIGKANWLAPEVFRGAKLDRRADLYALGLLFWHLLTQADPASSQARRAGPDEAFPPPSAFNPRVPRELNVVVAKATHADPGQRFQTANELAEAVGAYIPEGFAGKKEVAGLVFRNTSRLGDGLLPRLREEGRPLLDKPSPEVAPMAAERLNEIAAPEGSAPKPTKTMDPRARGRWRRSMVIFLSTGLMLGALFVIFMYLREGGRVPAAASVAPPPAVPPPRPEAVTESPTTAPAPSAGPRPIALPRSAVTAPHKPPAPEPGLAPAPAPAPILPVKQPRTDELLTAASDAFDRSELPQALAQAKLAAERGAGAPAQILIGRILAVRHDLAGAKTAFEEALRLSPGNTEAAHRLERLRRKMPDESP